MSKADEMRHAFDSSFAQPLPERDVARDQLLLVRVGGVQLALRAVELAGIHADRAVTRVPARAAGLIGVAGVRNAIVPVFDLGVLLGYPARGTAQRWLAITAAGSIGLAFEALDGHVVADRGATTVHVGGQALAVVRLEDVIASVMRKEI
jgi:chemotaxis signal transduction protein